MNVDAACASISMGASVGILHFNSGMTLTCAGQCYYGKTGIVDMTDGGTLSCATWNKHGSDLGYNFISGSGKVIFTSSFTLLDHANFDEFNDFEVAAGATLTLSRPIIINGTLTFTDGKFNLNGSILTLGSSGTASTLIRTASATTNWMYGGTFKRFWLPSTTDAAAYGLFPMGTSAASSYRPVEINSTADPTAGAGYFTVNHVNASGVINLSPYYNDAGTNIQRIDNSQFITAISGVTGGTYDIAVTMTGLLLTGNVSDIRLAIKTVPATEANAVGTHTVSTGTTANPTAKRTGITTLTDFNNDFRISTTDVSATPLPVSLLYFTAVLTLDKKVLCQWATASETNNDCFFVECTRDGINYDLIAKKDGAPAGNSSTALYYSVMDSDPYQGDSYYRLKQVDFNGDPFYSQLVPISLNSIDIINIFPNPGFNDFNYLVGNAEAGEITITVLDVLGRTIIQQQELIDAGITQKHLNISSLPVGSYLLKVTTKTMEKVQKKFVRRTPSE